MASTESPDLIVLDVMLPIMDGWQVLRALRLPEGGADVPVVDHVAALRFDYFGEAEPPVIVPGVAFTAAGMRLGRGKGFYDKYLSQPGFRAFKAGVCYPHQVVEELPADPFDIPVDHLCCGR